MTHDVRGSREEGRREGDEEGRTKGEVEGGDAPVHGVLNDLIGGDKAMELQKEWISKEPKTSCSNQM